MLAKKARGLDYYGKKKSARANVLFANVALYSCLMGLAQHGSAQAEEASLDADPTAVSDDGRGPIETVTIIGSRKAHYTEITEDSQKLVEMPGALGDPLGAITALPGVITPAGGGAPAVRGGSPNDNRYFIDGIPAGYIFHEFNTSILDENVVQDFQLFSAGFGSQYSNVTGGVFDIRLRQPKNQDLEVTLNASMLRAGVFVEGGITENVAFMGSLRKGLIQYFLPEEDEPDEEGIRLISPPQDSDHLLKVSYTPSASDTVDVTFIGAKDFAEAEFTDLSDTVQQNPDFEGDAKLEENFNSGGLTWNHLFHRGAEFTLSLAHYSDKESLTWGDGYFATSDLKNVFVKGRYSHPISLSHTLSLGGEHSQYTFDYSTRSVLFVCTEFDVSCQDGRRGIIDERTSETLNDSAVYVIDHWQVSDSFFIEGGVQWSKNDYTDEAIVNPRLALEWQIKDGLTLTSSAGRYNRLPDIEKTLPEIGNPRLKSPRADHLTLGIKGEFSDIWSWSAEAYRKDLSELPLALDESQADAELLYSNDVSGSAKGIDILVNRNLSNNWYGWVALSYSKSMRTNDRNGNDITYNLDTPLVFTTVGRYNFTDKWSGGFRFTAKSGEATTRIQGVQNNPDYPDKYLPIYGAPYEDRLPKYSRLDIRLERTLTLFNKQGSFYVDILNALNRKNITEITLDYEKVNETGALHIKKDADIEAFVSLGVSIKL